MTKPTRPVLKYYGGKWKIAPWIIAHLPPHRVYVEPFGGGASVLIRKPRSRAEVYNDLDGEIVNLFRVLRGPRAVDLIKALSATPFARDEFVLSYEPSDDPVEQARRTVVRSFMGFGSSGTSGNKTGFRTSGSRDGTTTPAREWVNVPDALHAIVDRLQGVVIENRDAAAVLLQHDGDETLHYVDPPYPHATRNSGKKGYRFEMSDDDHRELAAVLRAVRGMVVLSGYPCDLYDQELYPDWQRVTREALADGARPRTEVLWLNTAAATRLYADTTSLFDGAA